MAAHAATGIVGLDDAAIVVKAPSHVYLDTVTRAGTRLVAAGEHGVIIYSDDNGSTWRQSAVPIDATMTDLIFTSPEVGWAVGNSGVILHSADAGASWQLKLNGLQANHLTMTAAQSAVAQKSTEVGAPTSLRRAQFFMDQGANKPFLSILALSPDSILAFGAYRLVMRTTDGGATWCDWSLAVADPFSHDLYEALQVGPDIYVVGENGLVFRSSDGGNSFAAATSPANTTLFGAFATAQSLFVYGVAGSLFKSQDGAKHWSPVDIGTSSNLTAEVTLASGQMLLASQSGVIFSSRDKGATFQALPGGLPMALFDLVQAANGDVIAVGNFGVMKVPAGLLG